MKSSTRRVAGSGMGCLCSMEGGEDITVFLWPPRLMRVEGSWANTCLPKHIPVYGDDISVSGRSHWGELLPPQV